MRNNKKPISLNRFSPWYQGLILSVPFTVEDDIAAYDGLTIRELNHNKILFDNIGRSGPGTNVSNLIGPNGETIKLPSDVVRFPIKLPTILDGGFTLSFWFKRTGALSNTYPVLTITGGSNSHYFTVSSETQLSAVVQTFQSANIDTLEIDKWYHIVWTLEVGTLSIYLNGKLVHRYTNIFIITSILDSIGSYTTTISNSSNNAYVYDLRTYNHAWSEDKVGLFYNNISERVSLFTSNRSYAIPGVIPFITGGMNLHTINIASDNDTTNLYTSGESVPFSGGVNLHTIAILPISGNVDLYTRGLSSANSGINLYVRGLSSYSNSAELYVEGMIPFASSINLYTYGISQANTAVNLFVSTPNGVNNNDTINLYTNSTTNSGVFNTVSLFVKNSQQFDPRNSVNLSVKGPTGFDSESVNLFVQNQQDIDNGVDLFVAGPNFTYSSGINLFITTPNAGGDSDGYTPLFDSVTLFVARDSEAIGNSINMFVKTAEPVNSGVDLYSYGVFTQSSDINMFTSGSGIPVYTTDTVRFYLRGGV